MEEYPFIGAWVGFHLAAQAVERNFELRQFCLFPHRHQSFSGIDEVYIIGFRFVEVNFTLRIHNGVEPLVHIVVVFFIAGSFPEFVESQRAEALRVTKVKAFAVVELLGVRKAFQFRVCKAYRPFLRPTGLSRKQYDECQ